MKNIIFLLASVFILTSCSAGGSYKNYSKEMGKNNKNTTLTFVTYLEEQGKTDRAVIEGLKGKNDVAAVLYAANSNLNRQIVMSNFEQQKLVKPTEWTDVAQSTLPKFVDWVGGYMIAREVFGAMSSGNGSMSLQDGSTVNMDSGNTGSYNMFKDGGAVSLDSGNPNSYNELFGEGNSL